MFGHIYKSGESLKWEKPILKYLFEALDTLWLFYQNIITIKEKN